MPSRILPDILSSVPRILRKTKILWPILTVLLLAAASRAQQMQSPQGQQGPPRTDAPPAEQAPPQLPPQSPAPVTLPAGTELALVLTHPIDSKNMHRGDTVFAETTSPVFVKNEVIIPAGVFVQGKVEKLTRQGSRAELLMQTVSVALPDGSVVNIKGPLEITSGEGTAWRNPSDGAKVGAVLAPLIGLGLGTAIGAAAHTTQTTTFAGMTMTSNSLRGVTIGSITGLGTGTIVSFVLLARSRHFFVGEGSPLEMTLPQPVTVGGEQTAALAQITDQR